MTADNDTRHMTSFYNETLLSHSNFKLSPLSWHLLFLSRSFSTFLNDSNKCKDSPGLPSAHSQARRWLHHKCTPCRHRYHKPPTRRCLLSNRPPVRVHMGVSTKKLKLKKRVEGDGAATMTMKTQRLKIKGYRFNTAGQVLWAGWSSHEDDKEGHMVL